MSRPTNLSRTRVLTVTLSTMFLCVLSSVCAAQTITYGINYDVIATDTSLTPNCQNDPNATVHQKFIVPRYVNAPMQKAVREELKGLRQSGFQTIRSIIQLFPGISSSGDLINTGKIDDSVLNSISAYVGDVRDAGFKELILAFGTQGAANPTCRKSEWGDCFDPATIDASVEAEAKIVRTASSVKGISLRIDLLNEACVSNFGPKTANDNFTRFLRAAIKMHAASFPRIPATVSCQIERTGDGLVSTQQLFTEAGDHVGFFDIHAYPGPARSEPKSLQQAAGSLKGATTSVIFGETTYADPEYRQWIVHSFRASFHRDPQAILFWPLHSMSSHCNFDVAHPYRLKDALGTR